MKTAMMKKNAKWLTARNSRNASSGSPHRVRTA